MTKIVTKFKLKVVEYDSSGYYFPKYYTDVDVIAETLNQAEEKALERTPMKHSGGDWRQTVKVVSSEDVILESGELND